MTKRENKRTRRALLIAVLALVVCVATIGGTVAWLTANTAPVTNTFTPSDITITLTDDGTTVNEETKEATKSYKMVPGQVLDKNPTVGVVAGSEPCWVFVKVEKSSNYDTFITSSIDDSVWSPLPGYDGVYFIKKDNSEAATYPVLTGNKVTVKNTVTKEMMQGLTEANYPNIGFKAYAIQQANIVKGEEDETIEVTAWKLVSAS